MQKLFATVKCDTPAMVRMRIRPRGHMKSLQARNQSFGRKSSNPDREPIVRTVPTMTAPETVKKEDAAPSQARRR